MPGLLATVRGRGARRITVLDVSRFSLTRFGILVGGIFLAQFPLAEIAAAYGLG